MKMRPFLHLDRQEQITSRVTLYEPMQQEQHLHVDSSLTFGVVDICVQINSSKADLTKLLIYNISKLTGLHCTRDTANEHSLAWIRSLSLAALALAVCNEPRPHLHLQELGDR